MHWRVGRTERGVNVLQCGDSDDHLQLFFSEGRERGGTECNNVWKIKTSPAFLEQTIWTLLFIDNLFRWHLGGDIAGQVAEHDEDGTPEQSGAEHGTGVPGGQLRKGETDVLWHVWHAGQQQQPHPACGQPTYSSSQLWVVVQLHNHGPTSHLSIRHTFHVSLKAKPDLSFKFVQQRMFLL